MDYPEGARVLNISVDLGVYGRDDRPLPPIETYCRVIAEPVLRLTEHRPDAARTSTTLDDLFNFGNDYLGPGQGRGDRLGPDPAVVRGHRRRRCAEVLGRVIRPGHGLEVVSKVNDIPKGSRLAVSTNLLASLISLLMRATGQAREPDRPARPGRGAGGRRPRDPRRVAGRLRRRLAGLRRRLPRREGHPRRRRRPRTTPSTASAGAGCCPLHELFDEAGRRRWRRPIEPTPTSGRRSGPTSAEFAERCRKASCWSTAGWPRTSGRS